MHHCGKNCPRMLEFEIAGRKQTWNIKENGYHRVHTIMERSWKATEFEICIPGLEKSWKLEKGHGKVMEFQIFPKAVFS